MYVPGDISSLSRQFSLLQKAVRSGSKDWPENERKKKKKKKPILNVGCFVDEPSR